MTENNHKCDQLLIGAKQIRDYLHDMSEPIFYKFIKLGMPAAIINGRWYAWRSNLDDWFQQVTRKQEGQVPADVE